MATKEKLMAIAKSEGVFDTFFKEYYEKNHDEIVVIYDRYAGIKDGAAFALSRVNDIIAAGGNDYLVLQEIKSTIKELMKEL